MSCLKGARSVVAGSMQQLHRDEASADRKDIAHAPFYAQHGAESDSLADNAAKLQSAMPHGAQYSPHEAHAGSMLVANSLVKMSGLLIVRVHVSCVVVILRHRKIHLRHVHSSKKDGTRKSMSQHLMRQSPRHHRQPVSRPPVWRCRGSSAANMHARLSLMAACPQYLHCSWCCCRHTSLGLASAICMVLWHV